MQENNPSATTPTLKKPTATHRAAPVRKSKSTLAKASKPATKDSHPTKTAKAVKGAKAEKTKKPKLVRDSFTIPKEEYAALSALKQRCEQLGQPSKKSELLRAGILALAGMADKALLNAVRAVPALKTGRPKKA